MNMVILCIKDCDDNKYGENCSKSCGNCRGSEQCHHINGICINGCDIGYQLPKCIDSGYIVSRNIYCVIDYAVNLSLVERNM